LENTTAQYPGTGRFYYDSGRGFVYVCEGLDHQDDVILKEVFTAVVKVVSPRAIGSTFRTVHDVAKSGIKPAAGHKYMAVDTRAHPSALASKEVSAEEAALLPATVAVFTLVGMDEYFVRSLKRHAEKVLVPL
jgi:hypothetical protein